VPFVGSELQLCCCKLRDGTESGEIRLQLHSCGNQTLEVPTRREQNFPQKEQKLRFLPVGWSLQTYQAFGVPDRLTLQRRTFGTGSFFSSTFRTKAAQPAGTISAANNMKKSNILAALAGAAMVKKRGKSGPFPAYKGCI
jgi:hypothetical protein